MSRCSIRSGHSWQRERGYPIKSEYLSCSVGNRDVEFSCWKLSSSVSNLLISNFKDLLLFRILAMIDHYEGAIEQLRSKVASMVERQKQQKQKWVCFFPDLMRRCLWVSSSSFVSINEVKTLNKSNERTYIGLGDFFLVFFRKIYSGSILIFCGLTSDFFLKKVLFFSFV